jgi:hypothetical protein
MGLDISLRFVEVVEDGYYNDLLFIQGDRGRKVDGWEAIQRAQRGGSLSPDTEEMCGEVTLTGHWHIQNVLETLDCGLWLQAKAALAILPILKARYDADPEYSFRLILSWY